MPETATLTSTPAGVPQGRADECRVAVIWIDWYAYHIARFLGIQSAEALGGRVAGIELVGGVGVHAGLKFREELSSDLAIKTMMPGSNWSDAGQFRLALKLWRHLSQLRPEVLLVPGYYTLPALAAAVWAKLHRSKSVLMTESTADDHNRTWWKEWVKSALIRSLFDWAVTGGRAHVRYLRDLRFDPKRIVSFYDVVDNDFFRRSSLALRKQPAEAFDLPRSYFLYIGRLAPEKNVAGLISSWITYREAGGTWSLVIVGDGPCARELRSLAEASRFAADVHFAGHRTSTQLPVYYAFAGCFILPSTREPWGLVVNEAMASGLPVLVSSRCGCAEDLVTDGGNGFVFDPSDPNQLTQYLTRIENIGPEKRDAMGANSSKIIGQYTPRGFGKEIARIYSSSKT